MVLVSAATKLRRTLEDPQSFIAAPGVYDGLSARIALSVGFDALYMVRPLPYAASHL
jgi:methylisocitrate lyase